MPLGGTITFTGAIVAPPFELSVRTAAVPPAAGTLTARESVASPGRVAGNVADLASVDFTTPSGGQPQATVALTSPSGFAQHDITGRFVDAAGRVLRADRHGAYHVGAQGGVLSLGAVAAGTQPTVPVTVVVSYN